MNRERPTDIAKGLGILLVVAGHTIASWNSGHELLYKFIYSFHMPFFLGSGGMYIRADGPLVAFIKAKLIRLVVPFISWSLFYLCLAFFIQAIKNDLGTPTFGFAPKLLTVLLHGDWYSLDATGIYVDLWFLPALFSTVIITRLLAKWSDSQGLIASLGYCYLLSFSIVLFNDLLGSRPFSYWGIDIALASLPFVYLCKLRNYFYRVTPYFIFPLIVVVCMFSRTQEVSLAVLKISNYGSFIISASLGIILLFAISAWIQDWKIGRILGMLGERSYLVFLMAGAILTISGPARRMLWSVNDDFSNIISFFVVLVTAFFAYPLVASSVPLAFLAFGAKNSLQKQP
ncbi:acyltransferase family protein [Nitrospira lenta]|uniref:Acyltransferase 3 domain-containing protein n=1 Tax=Nitrospira lenta TaxID=1436998 RepID=A0A330LAD1_9BACT|nr:acyltransferase family protein [Nitrospira lenta]SPP66671.1 membrane hypothetical protein [Nitrospira lenta]